MLNRLAGETSPYLLQHQSNPVEWYPWGAEALARAKAEDKPIFLSIGYAACHWCHVMAHESFEEPATAAVMNERFVNIKVDREERPDLDSIYMNAVVALTGSGGWPMSVFLTPEQVPFYGGTYFPPRPAHGMPAFQQVLLGVADAWRNRRSEVLAGAQDVLRHMRQSEWVGLGPLGEALASETLKAAAQALWQQFDWRYHGWGGGPKFPQPMAMEFLLRYHTLTGEANPLDMVVKVARSMARGGLYDQLGGGFHRYATDTAWLVPHFEKMLYDNAQLARVYLHLWQVTGDPEFRRVAEETLDYVAREMTDPRGGFYSTQDADSEGHEGKFFVWTVAEIDSALGAQAELFKEAYGVTARGNFEGRSILFVGRTADELADRHNRPEAEVRGELAQARRALLAVRAQRVAPGRDDKVLAAWNGMTLAAFAEAARALGRADYRQVAVANGDFILGSLRREDGALLHSWRQGQARLNGYLEDYANVADGLLALYETTFEARYYSAAQQLMDYAQAHFGDANGGYFDTADEHEALVARPKDVQDNATPSGGAMLASGLLRLGALSGQALYTQAAEAALGGLQPALAQHPTAFAQWLVALAFALSRPREVALVGDPDEPGMQALLAVVNGAYRPFQVVALKRPGDEPPVPVLAGRAMLAGRATAAVCYNFACQLPVTEPEALRAQLERPVN